MSIQPRAQIRTGQRARCRRTNAEETLQCLRKEQGLRHCHSLKYRFREDKKRIITYRRSARRGKETLRLRRISRGFSEEPDISRLRRRRCD